MPTHQTTQVPEEKLSKKLDDDWLPSDPIKIEMVREPGTTPPTWTVTRHYK